MSKSKACELCGRIFKASHAQWCVLCLKTHTMFPVACKSCDGEMHVPDDWVGSVVTLGGD